MAVHGSDGDEARRSPAEAASRADRFQRPADRPVDPDRGLIAGIVLAGGRSRRFGRDKLREPVGGTPLLHRPIAALAAIASEIIVVVGHGATDPELPALTATALCVARDREADAGPVAGVEAGAMATDRPTVLVVAGDMPWIQPGVLRVMVERLAGAPEVDAIILADPERRQPLPFTARTPAVRRASDAAMASGERSLRALLDRLVVRELDATSWRALDPAGCTIADVDRPEDLRAPVRPTDRADPDD